MRLVVLTALVAGKMLAQDGLDLSKPALLVQGVVLDKYSRQPVEGATVSPLMSPADGPARTFPERSLSGASGDFQLGASPADRIAISAMAKHYQAGSTTVRVQPGQEIVNVEVLLVHLQSLEGVVVDDETRKPIPGLAVELVARTGGVSLELPVGSGRTVSGDDGRFAFADLPPAEYFLRISAKPAVAVEEIPAKDLEGEGRDKALEPPEGATSYGTVVWPGVWPGETADVPSTPGITIGPSAVDVGEIRLVRSKLTNLTGIAGPCEEGASLQVKVARAGENPARGLLAKRDLPCGSGFRLLNLPNGTLDLTALQGFPQRRWVSQTIDPRSRSPLRLTLNPFVAVEISVEMEDGKLEELPEGSRVTLLSGNPSIKVDQPATLRPGAFEATLYPGEQYKVWLQTGARFYVKRATYNAAALPDPSSFTASTAGVSQLNLVVSNKAASVEVHLTHNGEPLKTRQVLFLLKDGMNAEDIRQQTNRIPLVSGNALVFPGLAPGTYRVMRPSDEGVIPTTQPLFDAMLKDPSRQSDPVTVDEGQTATINWDIP